MKTFAMFLAIMGTIIGGAMGSIAIMMPGLLPVQTGIIAFAVGMIGAYSFGYLLKSV